MKKTKTKNKIRAEATLRFLRHFASESPKIFWRVATFTSSSRDIREEIILPLAEMLKNLKAEGLSIEEKEFHQFKFILYWPELILKIPWSFRRAAIRLGAAAAAEAPRFYNKAKVEKIDPKQLVELIKQELGLDQLQEALNLHTKPKVRKRRTRVTRKPGN